MMKLSRIESAMRVGLEFREALNRRDVAETMRLVSDDCVLESEGPAPEGAVYAGREAVAEFWRAFFANAPNAHVEIEEAFGLGE